MKNSGKFLKLKIIPFALVAVVLTACLCVRACERIEKRKYFSLAVEISLEEDINPALVLAVVKAESGFNVNARSEKGALGLMQLMPETADFIAEMTEYNKKIDLFDADCNLLLGCRYLKYLLKKFGDEFCALCAYNAGEGRVSEWLTADDYSADGKTLFRVPFAETRAYVEKIVKYKRTFAKILKKYA